nr:protein ENHANCED DISEASE RESISTANCE 2-like [Ipomoea batatas]
MEGWLYLIRLNRLGLQYCRKRYFILEDNCLQSYKAVPTNATDLEEPLRSAIIDSCIHVQDNGRESFHRKVFFTFTLCNTSNHDDQLKFGANSPEEAARWIRCLRDAAINPEKNLRAPAIRKWQPFSLSVSNRMSRKQSIDWNDASSTPVDAMTSDVVGPSPWKIFGIQNGLRLFKEAKDRHSNGKHWDGHPAIMAVGVIDGTSESIFKALMSLGPSRSEWDFCFSRGSVVEHLDGHTDIIHIQLTNHWLPWGLKRRDLLLRRYWRREDDGTYGKSSTVKHMLAVDWKSYLRKTTSKSITICMLGGIAALREMLKAKSGSYFLDPDMDELTIDIQLPVSEKEEIKNEVVVTERTEEDTTEKYPSACSSIVELDDVADEFFDVPEASDDEHSDLGWPRSTTPEFQVETHPPKLSSAACFVRKLQDLAVQKNIQEIVGSEEGAKGCYGCTLPKDASYNMPCSWAAADTSSFLIRGEKYLQDHSKITAKGTLTQMVGADWLQSEVREDNLAARPGSIVQKYAAQDRPEFFFVVNIQVPGATRYSLALYYMLKTPLAENPLLERFVNGDDAFRNSKFKLIPYISKLDVDVGSSTVARGVINLVLGYLNNLVIEMAFIVQADTAEELPEYLLGTCRLNHLDASKAIHTKSIS